MGLAEKDYLLQRAKIIMNETNDGSNTANRIGQMFVDIIEKANESIQESPNPIKVSSDEELDRMLEAGECEPGRIYYTEEES